MGIAWTSVNDCWDYTTASSPALLFASAFPSDLSAYPGLPKKVQMRPGNLYPPKSGRFRATQIASFGLALAQTLALLIEKPYGRLQSMRKVNVVRVCSSEMYMSVRY